MTLVTICFRHPSIHPSTQNLCMRRFISSLCHQPMGSFCSCVIVLHSSTLHTVGTHKLCKSLRHNDGTSASSALCLVPFLQAGSLSASQLPHGTQPGSEIQSLALVTSPGENALLAASDSRGLCQLWRLSGPGTPPEDPGARARGTCRGRATRGVPRHASGLPKVHPGGIGIAPGSHDGHGTW